MTHILGVCSWLWTLWCDNQYEMGGPTCGVFVLGYGPSGGIICLRLDNSHLGCLFRAMGPLIR